MDPYLNRDVYRSRTQNEGLTRFRVTLDETDLFIASAKDLSGEALKYIREIRLVIEEAIKKDSSFKSSLRPIDIFDDDPEEIRVMKNAGRLCRVGPMAAVAGMVSEYVGKKLLLMTDTVIVENGGDIFMRSSSPVNVGIYAPGSVLSGKLGIAADASEGIGVCTSSGTYGHSLSFGSSQAAVAVSPDTALADAAATRLGNLLKDPSRIERALEEIMGIEGIIGAAAVVDDRIGFLGDLEIRVLSL